MLWKIKRTRPRVRLNSFIVQISRGVSGNDTGVPRVSFHESRERERERNARRHRRSRDVRRAAKTRTSEAVTRQARRRSPTSTRISIENSIGDQMRMGETGCTSTLECTIYGECLWKKNFNTRPLWGVPNVESMDLSEYIGDWKRTPSFLSKEPRLYACCRGRRRSRLTRRTSP